MRLLPSSAVAALALALTAAPTEAAPFLLSSSFELQLESWLGQGNLTFTNIFEKTAGSTSTSFHAAADGQGATFTLLQATVAGNTYVIGGYNPQSWSQIGNYNYTPSDPDRTAFIYNLSTGVRQTQRLNSDPLGGDWAGQFQTSNAHNYGPTFGGGHDIYVDSNLTGGSTRQFSYGSAAGSSCMSGAVSYGAADILGLQNGCNVSPITVGALEVYRFAAITSVPEPGSFMLLGAGVTALIARLRRRHAKERA